MVQQMMTRQKKRVGQASKRLASSRRSTFTTKLDIVTTKELEKPPVIEPEILVRDSEITAEDLLQITSATASVKSDMLSVEKLLSLNKTTALEQHNELIRVMRGITTGMSQITDRLEYIEKDMIVINRKVLKNASDISETKRYSAAKQHDEVNAES